MKKATIQLETLTCPSCLQKINNGVKRLDGVDKNSVEVLMIQKEINDCLTKINSFEIVQKYNKALSEFNALLDKINKEILSF